MNRVDLPVRWVLGIVAASAAACIPVALAVVRAGIARYERVVGPVAPSDAYRPPLATEARPVPYSAPRGGIPS